MLYGPITTARRDMRRPGEARISSLYRSLGVIIKWYGDDFERRAFEYREKARQCSYPRTTVDHLKRYEVHETQI